MVSVRIFYLKIMCVYVRVFNLAVSLMDQLLWQDFFFFIFLFFVHSSEGGNILNRL